MLRVLLVLPFPPGSGRGNAVSAARLLRGLAGRGVAAEAVVAADPGSETRVQEAARRLAPTLVHGFQVHRAGPAAAGAARRLSVPLVVSFRGSDADECLDDPDCAGLVEGAARDAAVATVLTGVQEEKVVLHMPWLAPRILQVPQGVDARPGTRDFRGELGLAPGTPLVVQVAGLRPRKGLGNWIEILRRARSRLPSLQCALAGPVLDKGHADMVLAWIAATPWSRYLGELAHEDACALLAGADALLNTSLREGLCNALLEAMALGVPVVASAIPSNREVVRDGHDGLLFGDPDQGAAALVRVLEDRALASRLAEAARRTVARRFPPAAELEGMLEAYRLATVRRPPA